MFNYQQIFRFYAVLVKSFRLLALSAFLILIFTGCPKDSSINPTDSAKIEKGTETAVISATVDKTGGVITVPQTSTTLPGLKLTVNPNAYSDSRNFIISTIEIKKHSFGSNFNPLTPIIHIENGGGYSDEPMFIKIPVKIPSDKFAMAFMYNSTTGELEGMPLVNSDSTSITVCTRHFDIASVYPASTNFKSPAIQTQNKYAEMIVSALDKAYLDNVEANSRFLPGVDDWEFTNWGTIESAHGICSGMSVSSMWYFDFMKKDEGNLFQKFQSIYVADAVTRDKFWFDNTKGLFFASRAQVANELSINSPLGTINFQKYFNSFANQWKDQYRAFAYSVLLTNKPQYVCVRGSLGGHALVGYNIKNAEISVADPNWPSKTDRKIVMNLATGIFTPYEGFLDAAGSPVLFPQVFYIGRTAIVNYTELNNLYTTAISKISTRGEGCFPNYQIWVKDGSGYELGDKLVSDLDSLPVEILCPTCAASGITDFQFAVIDLIGNHVGGSGEPAIQLKSGENNLGFYISASADRDCSGGNPFTPENNWMDFRWIKVYYQTFVIASTETDGTPIIKPGVTNKSYTFKVDSKGLAPKNVKIIWNFSDKGFDETMINDTTIKHTFTKEGGFKIIVKIYDNATGIMLKKDSTVAKIGNTPVISSITPAIGPHGQTFTIYGSGFGQTQKSGDNACLFLDPQNENLYTALYATSWSDTKIETSISNAESKHGNLNVKIRIYNPDKLDYTWSNAVPFYLINPIISGIKPDSIMTDSIVTITGKWFLENSSIKEIDFSGKNSNGIISWTDTEIKCLAPKLTTGQISISINIDGHLYNRYGSAINTVYKATPSYIFDYLKKSASSLSQSKSYFNCDYSGTLTYYDTSGVATSSQNISSSRSLSLWDDASLASYSTIGNTFKISATNSSSDYFECSGTISSNGKVLTQATIVRMNSFGKTTLRCTFNNLPLSSASCNASEKDYSWDYLVNGANSTSYVTEFYEATFDNGGKGKLWSDIKASSEKQIRLLLGAILK